MLAFQDIIEAELTPDAAQILGGTLCLMSCALASLLNSAAAQDTAADTAFYIRRIANNLALLGDDLNLDQHFRRMCKRLCEHWELKLDLLNEPKTIATPAAAPTREAQFGTPRHITSHTNTTVGTRAVTDALAASVRLP